MSRDKVSESRKIIKDLYMASGLEELQQLAAQANINEKLYQAKTLHNSAVNLFQHGKAQLHTGDEEKAFIYFMRFMKLFNSIKVRNNSLAYEYQVVSELYNNLSKNLEKRYESKNVESTTKQAVERTPLPEPSRPEREGPYIHCVDLYKLTKAGCNVILFDSRPAADYAESRVKFAKCANVPEEVIEQGLSAHVLASKLPKETKDLWNQRHLAQEIVLMDWQTTSDSLDLSKLKILYDIFTLWDPQMNSKQPLILEGGYLEFLRTFPMLCTDPHVVYKVENLMLNDLLDIDRIEYPTVPEAGGGGGAVAEAGSAVPRPTVDRATKPAVQRRDEAARPDSPPLNFLPPAGEDAPRAGKHLADQANEKIKRAAPPDLHDDDDAADQDDDDDDQGPADDGARGQESERNRLLALARERKKLLKSRADDAVRPSGEPRPTRPRVTRETRPAVDRNAKPGRTGALRNLCRRSPFSGGEIPSLRNVRPSALSARGLVGLSNIGNSCYMNSVLQCLSNTEGIASYFNCDYHQADSNKNEGTCGIVSFEFGKVVKALWGSEGKYLAPHDFKNVVVEYAPRFRGTQHQDAHEFLMILINWLHDELKRDVAAPKSSPPTPSEKSWNSQTELKESIISRLFCGQMESVTACTECWKRSCTYDIFQDMILQLPNGDSVALDECMSAHFNKEIISGWNCPRCKTERDVMKQFQLSRVPNVLVITLKRFSETVDTNLPSRCFRKNDIAVDFPINGLHLVSGVRYNLYAVVNHSGEMDRGHYTAVCRNPLLDSWYKYDDEQVSRVSSIADSLDFRKAYILFYVASNCN